MSKTRKNRKPKDGGFHDLDSFRSEVGVSTSEVSDADARRIIDESLNQRVNLEPAHRNLLDALPGSHADSDYKAIADNMRMRADSEERERKNLADELARERASKAAELDRERASKAAELARERASKAAVQSRLQDEIELEKMKRLYGDRIVWRSPGSLDDYLTKERLKREVKNELLDEKQRELERKKILNALTKPRSRSRSQNRSRSKSKTKAKPKARKAKK
jgi:hypothetical protein